MSPNNVVKLHGAARLPIARTIENAAFTLSFEDRAGYLYAHVSGPARSFIAMHGYWSAVAAECRRRNVHCLMVADELHGAPAVHELMEVIETVLKPSLKNVRIAFVTLTPANRQIVEFAEMLLRRYGIDVHGFLSVPAAEAWLLAALPRPEAGSMPAA